MNAKKADKISDEAILAQVRSVHPANFTYNVQLTHRSLAHSSQQDKTRLRMLSLVSCTCSQHTQKPKLDSERRLPKRVRSVVARISTTTPSWVFLTSTPFVVRRSAFSLPPHRLLDCKHNDLIL